MVKKTLREDELDDGIICIDDTVEEKQYTDENEVICYHFDHTKGRSIKGVNMLSFLYLGKGLTIPIAFEIIKKPHIADKEIVDKQGNKKIIKTRKSDKTKHTMVQENINQIVQNQVKFKYVVMDIWFGCNETLELIKKYKKCFVVPLKTNRQIALSKRDQSSGNWVKLEGIEFKTDQPIEIWLNGLSFPVLLVKKIFTNEDGSIGIMYLITNDYSLKSTDEIYSVYQKRWKIEEFFKSLKSNLAFAKAPTKNTFTQINHFFCSIYTYFKTEILLKSTNFKNHFQMKSHLLLKALKSTMGELEDLRARGVGCER